MSEFEQGRLYKTATVTRLTGFRPELLRAWERRHGLLEPARTAGGHRMYTQDDLAVLLLIRERLDEGQAIGALAQEGREALLGAAERRRGNSGLGSPEEPAPATVAPLPDRLDQLRAQLVVAARRIDAQAARSVLDETFAIAAPERALERALLPALREVGALWAEGRVSVAGEHLVSAMLRDRLVQLLQWTRVEGRGRGEVITACLPGEQHEIPALIVAWTLARRGWSVIHLGAGLPLGDLERALARRRPDAVLLSATIPQRYDEARPALADLAERWAGLVTVAVGGPGVPDRDEALQARGVLLSALPELDEARESGGAGD